VAVNPGGRGALRGGAATDDIGGVQRFAQNLGVTYRVGLEETATYGSFAESFRGSNPFPIDIIVDRRGIVRYIAREYDPDAMQSVIDTLLAE